MVSARKRLISLVAGVILATGVSAQNRDTTITGGFNLQAAWSTGDAVARALAKS